MAMKIGWGLWTFMPEALAAHHAEVGLRTTRGEAKTAAHLRRRVAVRRTPGTLRAAGVVGGEVLRLPHGAGEQHRVTGRWGETIALG